MQAGVINIIANRNKDSQITMQKLRKLLSQYSYRVTTEFDPRAVLTVCIGGDGAFLRAVHKTAFPTVPFVGVNTGHLGFFQEIRKSELESFVQNFHHGYVHHVQ